MYVLVITEYAMCVNFDIIVFIFQSFDISSQEMQWVCDHLGHTLDVHKTHYRSVSDVLERVEIAKLLLIQDMNLVGKFHGQKLKDIHVEGKAN